MFYKSIIALSITLLLTSCVSSSFSYDKKTSSVSFPLQEINKKILLTDVKYQNTFSNCSLDTYILSAKSQEYGNLFIENIELSSNCQWNGLASGFFIYELKNRLKFKTFKLVDRFTKENYEISTYKVDGDKYLNILERYTVNGNVLIIDNRGKLSAEIIKNLDPRFELKYLNESRTDINYNYSLVDNNFIFGYFGIESMSDKEIK